MPFKMGSLTSFPMEKLCSDLKLGVLERIDAKDVAKLVKVNQGYQEMLARDRLIESEVASHAVQNEEFDIISDGEFSTSGTGVQSAYFGVEAQPAAGNQPIYFSAESYDNPTATGGAPMPAAGCTTPDPMDRSLDLISTSEQQDRASELTQRQRHSNAILLAAKRSGVPGMELFDSPAPMDRSLLGPLSTPEQQDLALGLTPRQRRGRGLFDSPEPTKRGGASTMTAVEGPAGVLPSTMTAVGHTDGGVGASGGASKIVEAPVPTTAPGGGAATLAYFAAPGQATGGGAQSASFVRTE